jgi:hypothetical protein
MRARETDRGMRWESSGGREGRESCGRPTWIERGTTENDQGRGARRDLGSRTRHGTWDVRSSIRDQERGSGAVGLGGVLSHVEVRGTRKGVPRRTLFPVPHTPSYAGVCDEEHGRHSHVPRSTSSAPRPSFPIEYAAFGRDGLLVPCRTNPEQRHRTRLSSLSPVAVVAWTWYQGWARPLPTKRRVRFPPSLFILTLWHRSSAV